MIKWCVDKTAAAEYISKGPEIMKKIKDFLYNINDIVIALVIVALAALLIISRINVLMDYSTVAEASSSTEVATSDDGGNGEDSGDGEASGEGEGGEVSADGSYPHSLYIAYGESTDSIGQSLVNLGLFSSVEEFNTAVDAAGAATKLQAGTFTIPQNATHEEVIEILTKPGA